MRVYRQTDMPQPFWPSQLSGREDHELHRVRCDRKPSGSDISFRRSLLSLLAPGPSWKIAVHNYLCMVVWSLVEIHGQKHDY